MQKALTVDPDYAPAWALKSALHSAHADYALVPAREGYAQARAAAEKALALGPGAAVAHVQLGYIARSHERDLAAAARHFEHALALAPADLGTLGIVARFLRSLGRVEAALSVLDYVAARDPANASNYFSLGISSFMIRRSEPALEALHVPLALAPGMIAAQALVGLLLLQQGHPERALAAAAQEPDEAHRLIALAMVLHSVGRQAESDAVLAELVERYAGDSAYNIAYVLASSRSEVKPSNLPGATSVMRPVVRA